jgi:CRP/FNR family transcriptional regulator, cyclic AMP receptor protein
MEVNLMGNYASILKQTDIFYNFTSTQLELVADICQESAYDAGETIFLEGTDSKELYVIFHGEVEILVNPSLVSAQAEAEFPPVTIATLRRGQSFGEIALVDDGLRSATARAAQNNTRLLIIPADRLTFLCNTYPQLGHQLMRNLAADLALKIRNTDMRFREQILYSQKQPSQQAH